MTTTKLKAYKMTYVSNVTNGLHSVIVRAINAQEVRERYQHMNIHAIQDYNNDDLGFESFGK